MRSAAGPEQVIRFAAYEADLRAGELRKHGIRIKLQDQPFQILVMLLERPGEVVTREDLRQNLWPGDTFVDFDHGLNNAINRLREALNDSAESSRYIETLPRRGYRFVAPVESSSAGAGGPSAVSRPAFPPAEAPAPTDKPATGETAAEPAGGHRREKLWAGALAFAALLALVVGLNVGGLRQRLFPRSYPEPIRSIAVLPFDNLTGDPGQEYFVDGMTDAVITDLAQIGALRVISRISTMQYRGTKKPLRQIGQELNVDAVVEGAVVRSGNRVRIDAQLIHAQTDRHLWARSYERDLPDIVALQSEVARAIAGEIQVKLTPQENSRLATARSVNPEAYEAYLLGRFYWNKSSPEDFEKAMGYFQQAIQKDPNNAPAYSGLSDCYRFLALYGRSSPGEVMPKAEAAALRALQLDDSLPEAHASLAAVLYRYHWDWPRSEMEFRRALDLNPNFSTDHQEYSVFLRALGRTDEAIAEAKRARDLDPLSPRGASFLGAAYHSASRYDDAIAQHRKALELDPDFLQAHFYLGLEYEQKGDLPRAVEEFEKAVSLSKRHPLYLATLGYSYAASGQRGRADNILSEIKKLAQSSYVSPVDMAVMYWGLGNKQQTLAWLEKAYQERSFQLLFTFSTDDRFDGLRSDPQFVDLARRVGLPSERTPQRARTPVTERTR